MSFRGPWLPEVQAARVQERRKEMPTTDRNFRRYDNGYERMEIKHKVDLSRWVKRYNCLLGDACGIMRDNQLTIGVVLLRGSPAHAMEGGDDKACCWHFVCLGR